MTPFSELSLIDDRRDEMIETLINWCDINSGTHHLDGLARMRNVLADAFDSLGADLDQVEVPTVEQVGDDGELHSVTIAPGMRWRKRADRDRTVFLCIHMDTVYENDHAFQTCRWQDDGRLNGPGVADAKGGLMVLLSALLAFEQSPIADQIGWEVFVNSDEEIGSPGSSGYFQEAARQHQFGLLFEPTLPDGTMVNQRKGSGNFTCSVRGVAAHAGREFEKGRNAIVQLAKLAQQFDQLNQEREGVTLNVGRILGGGAVNVVPDLALARINARVGTEEDGEWLLQRLNDIMHQANQPNTEPGQDGFRHDLHGGLTSPPKIPDERVRSIEHWIERAGSELGHDVNWKSTGGTCDGNKLLHYGLPNVDTLGVRGGAIHSKDEFLIPESLAERAKLTALLLHRYASGDLEG